MRHGRSIVFPVKTKVHHWGTGVYIDNISLNDLSYSGQPAWVASGTNTDIDGVGFGTFTGAAKVEFSDNVVYGAGIVIEQTDVFGKLWNDTSLLLLSTIIADVGDPLGLPGSRNSTDFRYCWVTNDEGDRNQDGFPFLWYPYPNFEHNAAELEIASEYSPLIGM